MQAELLRRLVKPLILFGIGGLLYVLIEILWRGYSHWTMFILGGLCFLYAGAENEYTDWEVPIYLQSIKTAIVITFLEFICGVIVNMCLQWNVWDYSNMPFNFLGQICPQFSFLWLFVGTGAIILDDYLRYWLFDEEKPHYKMF